jgi:CheY-like chemotaxis protein
LVTLAQLFKKDLGLFAQKRQIARRYRPVPSIINLRKGIFFQRRAQIRTRTHLRPGPSRKTATLQLLLFSINIMDQPTSTKRVLIVDDNSQAADVAAELLSLYGYQTAVAYGGAAGLRTAKEFLPDAILLDLGMPLMDGFQVAAALRAQPEFGNLALIAFTAWGDRGTRQRTHDAGFDQHITKPADVEQILRAIASACDMRAGFARKMA